MSRVRRATCGAPPPTGPCPHARLPITCTPAADSRKRSPTEEKSATEFRADPLHPNEIPGRAFPGAKDARPFEKQAEVRTFTTERLARPVEWTGKVQAELYVSSSAKDTDFIVRVCDVYPDGRSILLMDYVRRARYRDGYDKEVFMEPGKIYKVAFDVGWISQIFNVGHRIRITVASTGAPFYEPNPNTGEPLTIEFPAKTVVATNAVHHDRQHASRVIAPLCSLDEQRGSTRTRPQTTRRAAWRSSGAIRTFTPTRPFSPRGYRGRCGTKQTATPADAALQTQGARSKACSASRHSKPAALPGRIARANWSAATSLRSTARCNPSV